MASTAIRAKWKYETRAYIVLIICLLAYTALTLLQPIIVPNNPYNLSALQILLLQVTIIGPVAATWLMAFSGASTFKRYAVLIQGSTESPAIGLIANGLLVTLGYLVLSALLGSALAYFVGSPAHATLLIVRDYLAATTAITAFILLYLGSDRLRNVARFSTWTLSTIWLLGIYLVFSGAFVLSFLTLTPYQATDAQSAAAVVPPTILLFTFILPYLLAWFLGLLAGLNIMRYARHVKGSIYKKALRNLVLGIWSVVLLVIVLQALTLASRSLVHLSLSSILLLIYVLLVLYGLGFLFIRSGAKKLTHIEVAE